ncbi:phosphoglycerate mutase-like protein [Aspergillus ellipticus CBS 707.79]|uniref:Phosphoglycerate mutase-like protein n=1 Tax=Aspergillus ellipticus CBS 707.79 TaxID=1448320 RepID=A0A319CW54_9EURO|nr:phosphoglycerate mutase-like protein [Aspergillus ellipticus CBS 707.79]
MPPTLYLIRHGQGEHNINNSHHLRDALLTDLGKEQCRNLRDTFPYHADVSLILASPLKRATQTAAYVFAPTLEQRQLPFLLVPLTQEISGLQCDFGHDEEVIKAEAPTLIAAAAPGYDTAQVDMDLVTGDWNSKKGIYAPTLSAVHQRAAEFRRWLYKRPEQHIALVSHGGFMHYLTEDWSTYDKSKGERHPRCKRRSRLLNDCHGYRLRELRVWTICIHGGLD